MRFSGLERLPERRHLPGIRLKQPRGCEEHHSFNEPTGVLILVSQWEIQESPITKAPVKRAQYIVPPLLCERGEVSDNDISPHRAGRVTQSHPGCHRQWCRLHPEPHQLPIRIKAWGIPHEDPLQPLALRAPDNRRDPDVSTASRHRMSGCHRAPTPSWLTAEASQSPRQWRGR